MRQYDFDFNHSIEGDYLEVSLKDELSIDMIAYKVIQRNTMSNMLPYTRYDRNGNAIFRINVNNYVALHYRLDTFYNKIDEYVELGLGIIKPLLEVKDYMADYHNFIYNPEFVFYSKDDSAVKYIYIPSSEYAASDDEIMDFLKTVLKRPHVEGNSEAVQFQMEIFRVFDSGNVTLKGLYKLFEDESKKRMGKKKSNTNVVKNDAMTARISPEQVNAALAKNVMNSPKQVVVDTPKTVEKKEDIKPISVETKDNAFDIFGADPKKSKSKEKNNKTKEKKEGFSLFGGKKNEKKDQITPVQPIKETIPKVVNKPAPRMIQSPIEARDEMTQIQSNIRDDYSGATLIMIESPGVGGPERVSLNFNGEHISFGRKAKDTPPCDVQFPEAWKNIGRLHAWIEKGVNGTYSLIDLGSANHTTLNGEIIIPNKKYVLNDGDEIGFAQNNPVKYRVKL